MSACKAVKIMKHICVFYKPNHFALKHSDFTSKRWL